MIQVLATPCPKNCHQVAQAHTEYLVADCPVFNVMTDKNSPICNNLKQ